MKDFAGIELLFKSRETFKFGIDFFLNSVEIPENNGLGGGRLQDNIKSLSYGHRLICWYQRARISWSVLRHSGYSGTGSPAHCPPNRGLLI